MDEMANSAGALDEAYATYLGSAEAHIKQFQAAYQRLASTVIDSGLVGTFIDIGTAIINFATGLQEVGALLPTIAAIGTALGFINPAGWVVAGLSIVLDITSRIKDLVDNWPTLDNLTAKLNESASASNEFHRSASALNDTAKNLVPRFVELAQGVNEYGENEKLSNEEYKEFISLNNQIADLLPDAVVGYDKEGNAILNVSYSADTLSDSLERLIRLQKEALRDDITKRMDEDVQYAAGIEKLRQNEINNLQAQITLAQKLYTQLEKSPALEFATQNQMKGVLDAAGVSWSSITGNVMVNGNLDVARQTVKSYIYSLEQAIEEHQNEIQNAWAKLNPLARSWLESDYLFYELPEELQKIAVHMVDSLNPQKLGLDTSADIQSYIQNSIIKPLTDIGPGVSDAFAKTMDFKKAFRQGEMSAEEFTQKVKLAFVDMLMSADDQEAFSATFVKAMNEAGYSGTTFMDVVYSIIESMSKVEPAANDAGNALKNAFNSKTLHDAVSTLKSAFDDIGKDDSVGVTYASLEKIKDAFASSVPNIDQYINRIISAGTNSQQLTNVLNELVSAKINDIVQTQNVTAEDEKLIAAMLRDIGVSNSEAVARKIVADATGQTEDALYRLRLAEIEANNAHMTFDQQIASLQQLAEAAGITLASLDALSKVSQGLAVDEETGLLDVDALAASTKAMSRGGGIKNMLDTAISDMRKALSTSYDFKWTPPPGGGGGSSCGSKETKEATEEVKSAVDALSESISNLKTAYDALKTAEEEMRNGGGLTADTLRALSAAGADYVDCLYVQDGAIRLNTQAYQDYLAEGVQASIVAAQEEIAALRESNEALVERRDALLASGGSNVQASEEFIELNEKIEENTLKLQENQMQLLLYKMDLDELSGSLVNYSIAVENLTEVSDLVKDIASGMKTLADLEEEVAEGYALDLETALQYAETFPEILNAAQATADGRLRLDAEVVEAVIENREAEYRASIAEKIAELEADREILVTRKALKQSQLEFLKKSASGEIKIDQQRAATIVKLSDRAVQELIAQGYSEAEANRIVSENLINNTDLVIETVDNLANAYGEDVVLGLAAAANSSAANMGAMVNNINSAIEAAHELAIALAAASHGAVAGSTVEFSGQGGTANTTHFTAKTVNANALTQALMSVNGSASDLFDMLSDATNEFDSLVLQITKEIDDIDSQILQTDGQIQALHALMNKPLDSYKPKKQTETSIEDLKKELEKATDEMEDSVSEADSWFKTLYTLHQHLLAMGAETQREYLDWLDVAYRQAAHEGILSLEEFFRYQEEVYKGFQDLFKNDISNAEFMIDVRSHFEQESKTIVDIYERMLDDVAGEIAAYRKRGKDETDEYLQYLEKKYLDLEDSLKQYRDDIEENAKDSLDELVQLRENMLKESLEDEKESIDERLNELQDFYNKQKDMLKKERDEEAYLDKQAEHRKKVARLRSQLEQLEVDDSAWAQKRKLELAEELATAQKNLDDFERDHALDVTEEQLKETYEAQKKGLEDQKQLLTDQVKEANDLYEQALEDIRNGSVQLYEEMVTWNELYGDGIEDTIKNAWEDAYKALAEYKTLYDSLYNGVDLQNATGYAGTGKYNESVIGTPYVPPAEPVSAPTLRNGNLVTVKTSARYYSQRSGYEKISPDIPGGQYLIYDVKGDEVLIGRDGMRIGWIKKSDIEGYRFGTSSATAGLRRIDEEGSETIFESASGRKYRMFSGGEMVLSAQESKFLYSWVKENTRISGSAKSKLRPPSAGINPPPKVVEIQMGGVTINGNADRYTVSEIRRAQRDSIDTLLKEFNKLNK